ncbi:expressed unknown protein [Seminavis robusta]|uniref:Uncharacterized protein n=1 Tax=Seminavis robusta TaxID=568900 RepID=A0A9N8DXD8_9STRA|nr:expressed unknown protein [Seminavis robusta]|eukprot:Sro318_g115940.1 n/a (243) ;mRNA; r:38578-39460
MDTSELDEITKHLAELELYRPQSLSESMQKQSLVAEHKKNLNGLIPEDSDELRRDTEVVSSHIAQCTLPTVNRTQSRRVRLEEKDCLLIRQPLFSMYENVILEDSSQFFGLTGPRGFGKSAFLQYLTTKHIHGSNYLVVFLPVCPDEVGEMKIHLATAFYQGCRIAQLQGYPQLSRLAELGDMVRTCVGFAKGNNKTLLLVIDQMKTEDPQFFHPTINKISNVLRFPRRILPTRRFRLQQRS